MIQLINNLFYNNRTLKIDRPTRVPLNLMKIQYLLRSKPASKAQIFNSGIGKSTLVDEVGGSL